MVRKGPVDRALERQQAVPDRGQVLVAFGEIVVEKLGQESLVERAWISAQDALAFLSVLPSNWRTRPASSPGSKGLVR